MLGLPWFHEGFLRPTCLDLGPKQLLQVEAVLRVDRLEPWTQANLGHMPGVGVTDEDEPMNKVKRR